MRKGVLVIGAVWVLFMLIACSQTSWANSFVEYNGIGYEITDEEVPEEAVGELLGEVKRDVSNMDTAADYSGQDFDSNELDVGTKLFALKEIDNDIIVYEKAGAYFIARNTEIEE